MGKANPDGKPKGRMSAYAYFVQTCREEHKKKHPNENVVFAEFSRKCADRWKVNIYTPTIVTLLVSMYESRVCYVVVAPDKFFACLCV